MACFLSDLFDVIILISTLILLLSSGDTYYCLLYLFIVAKDSSNPVFLKLVLQGLAADWKVDKDLLVANLKSSQGSAQLEPSTSNISHTSGDGTGKQASSEIQVPFQRTPSPALSPDLCYVSADSLSSFGELCMLPFPGCLVPFCFVFFLPFIN